MQPFADLIERYGQAIRDGDRATLKSMFTDDVVTFDAMPPLENVGGAVVAERLDRWIDLYDGPIDCELRFGGSSQEGSLGFCWFMERISGTSRKGVAIDMWVRVTWCLRKAGDDWKAVHQHLSDPFEPETLKARIDLKPEQ